MCKRSYFIIRERSFPGTPHCTESTYHDELQDLPSNEPIWEELSKKLKRMQHDSPTSSVTLSYSVHTYRCLFGVYRFTGGKLVRMTAWPIREHHTSHDRRTGRLDAGLIKRLHYSGNSELTKSASPLHGGWVGLTGVLRTVHLLILCP